jgi:nitrate reductase gamma subunit
MQSPWKLVTIASWVFVATGITCAAITSRAVGKPTWWLGPESNPAPALLWVLPFVFPVAAILAVLRAPKWAGFIGMGSALALGAIAVGDIELTPGVAIIEGVIAVAALLIAVASLAGKPTS